MVNAKDEDEGRKKKKEKGTAIKTMASECWVTKLQRVKIVLIKINVSYSFFAFEKRRYF